MPIEAAICLMTLKTLGLTVAKTAYSSVPGSWVAVPTSMTATFL